MAPKRKLTRRARTSDRPPASEPNPTTISPSTSVFTSETATASLLPSSGLPSAPPTTATTNQPVLSMPIPPPSLASAIATTQPPAPPPPPPLSIQYTHQEHVSGTSVGTTTTTDSAGPSTAPSASAASRKFPAVILPITEEFLFHFLPKFITRVLAMEELREIVPDVTVSQPRPMDSDLRTLLEVAEKEMKKLWDFVSELEKVMGGPLTLLKEEEMNWDYRSGDSSGGSKREGGGPDSGRGGGDGQGGGVCV